MKQESMVLQLTRFSAPLVLSGILQQLYSWADAFIVGHAEGEAALAAIGATGTITYFFIMAITGFTLGLSVLSAQTYGEGRLDVLPRLLSSFLVLLGGTFLLLTLAGMALVRPMLELMDTPADILQLSRDYLLLVLPGIPFLAVYNTYAAFIRSIGDSKAPFYAVLLSSCTNVVLDVVMVTVLGWGVKGAALATVISQGAMTVFIVLYALDHHPILTFSLKERLIYPDLVARGLTFGGPSTIQSTGSAVGNLFLQSFMNGFGTPTVAAITTAYRVDSIMLLPIINLGTAISTMTAQSKGAGERRRIGRYLFIGLAMMTVVSLVLTAAMILFGGALVSMFGVEAQAAAIGRDFFRAIAMFYILFALAHGIRGALEGIGDMVFSSAAGIFALVCRIALSYLLAPHLGNLVIAYAEGLSWLILLALYLLRMVMKRRELGLTS